MNTLKSLVLVEDEREIRQGLLDFVPWNDLGFQVTADFENGKTALAYLLKSPSDVVLTDIRMPVMDGLALARELQAAGYPGVVILHTGHKDFEYARQAMEYGVRQYLVKGARFSALTAALKKIAEDGAGPVPRRPPAVEEDSHGRLVAAVRSYVSHSAGGTLSLKTIADRVGLHEDYLGRIFREETGQYFSDYVLGLRMADARTRLESGSLTVAEVATLAGYTSPKNFARAFQKHWGAAPSSLRPPVHRHAP